jgi:hypothetical protein
MLLLCHPAFSNIFRSLKLISSTNFIILFLFQSFSHVQFEAKKFIPIFIQYQILTGYFLELATQLFRASFKSNLLGP